MNVRGSASKQNNPAMKNAKPSSNCVDNTCLSKISCSEYAALSIKQQAGKIPVALLRQFDTDITSALKKLEKLPKSSPNNAISDLITVISGESLPDFWSDTTKNLQAKVADYREAKKASSTISTWTKKVELAKAKDILDVANACIKKDDTEGQTVVAALTWLKEYHENKQRHVIDKKRETKVVAVYEEAQAEVTAHKENDPENKEKLAQLEADAKAKFSKTNRGRWQLGTAIDGVTTHERVKNAVEKCRTNLDVNQEYTYADKCIGNILKQHKGKLNAESGTAIGKAIKDLFQFSIP